MDIGFRLIVKKYGIDVLDWIVSIDEQKYSELHDDAISSMIVW